MAQTENIHGGDAATTAAKMTAESDEILSDFTNSFGFDRRLFDVDARVGLAWSDALFHAGVLNRLEAERLRNGLQSIVKRAGFDRNYFSDLPAKDVYSFVDARLVQLVGETGRKLEIGRSLEDRAATVLRLWLREEIEKISDFARLFQLALIDAAERQGNAVLPVYAHLQRAQPILWAHWCLAYFEMLVRDRERLDEAWRRVNVLPLGAGAAAAGTNFEIDREQLARDLGFEGVSLNSVDAVSDRDFAVEFLHACALLVMHLSRFAADLILYASDEFRFVEFVQTNSDAEKNRAAREKNLRALELVRGKAGRVFGHQIALLTALKGLPTAINADLQEDKEAVFDAADSVKNSLSAAAAVLENLRLQEETARAASMNDYSNAREFSDYLILKDVSVSVARQAVEKIMQHAVSNSKKPHELTLAEMQKFSAQIEVDIFKFLSVEQSLAGKSQIGGTSPERVSESLTAARGALEMEQTGRDKK
ncbi:MAG: argininosuccinate lyase [Acidobacteria bacterium]|nr:argininosuccinate lyase [Acidobacteriota bacterium]